jgi:type IV pilus assembly protein PilM
MDLKREISLKPKMPKMPAIALNRKISLNPKVSLNSKRSFGHRSSSRDVIGLDIQPGYAAAVQISTNGVIRVRRAAGIPLDLDVVRDGEVLDVGALSDSLRKLFRDSGLDNHVRVGLANQRTVLRTLDLPPIDNPKELAAAVRYQAEDEVPMPLDNAVLDFQPLGLANTPAGPRQRIILVAAQRDLVERLLDAVRGAGLRPEGVDLSAFAMIRSLYRRTDGPVQPMVYLSVGGLTNMAIAEGTICRFTRMLGGGLESMAVALASRREMPVGQSRRWINQVDLTIAVTEDAASLDTTEHDARVILSNGIREIAGEMRNSLDFHRAQVGGEPVAGVVLSGPAVEITGFAETLQQELGLPVRPGTVESASDDAFEDVAADRLAVAAGLATEDDPS